MSKTVHIIGSGFSGMTLAYRLSQQGIQVVVYDQNEHVGGLISSHTLGNTIAEAAAPSISRTERVENFCKEVGADILEPKKTSQNRFIYRDGVTKWPLNFFETVGLILKGALSKILGNLPPRAFETLQAWGQRNLGKKASHFTLETGMQGVYAGDATKLSATLLLGPMFNKNRERFKGVLGFKNGMNDLFKAMQSKIEAAGGKFVLNKPVDLKDLSGTIVIATAAHQAAEILRSSHPELTGLLDQIEMIPLASVTTTFPQKSLPEGFGCLIPRGQNLKTLGVLINSSIFERGWKERSETWIIGGATEPRLVSLPDADLKDLIMKERLRLFNDESPMIEMRTTRWPKALPHYTVQLEKILPSIHQLRKQLETDHRIYLHGNYLGGIGLSKILEQSDMLAQRILNSHG